MLYLLLDSLRAWLSDIGAYPIFRVFDEVQFRALAAVALAFAIVVGLGPTTIRWLHRMRIGDTGETDAEALRQHAASRTNTPTMGGVLIAGAIGLSTLLLADVSKFHVQLALIVLLWMAVLGGVDDWLKLTSSRRGGGRQGLYAWEKLVFQVGLGLLVGVFLYRHGDNPEVSGDVAHVLNLPFQKTYVSSLDGGLQEGLVFLSRTAFVVLSVVLIAGMSNAVNITDGMDGLASGITAAVSLGLLVLTLIGGRQEYAQYLLVPHVPFADELGVVAGAMLGACLGFLWWNCAPAAVFMGDTGSLALGGMLAYLAIVIRQEIALLVMSAVFLWEITSVVIQVGVFKATKGRRVFRCAPYHHHLHLLGWTPQQIVVRAWIVSALLVVVGLASIKVR